MEIHVKVDTKLMKSLSKLASSDDYELSENQVLANALGVYRWALEEKSKGRQVFSCNEDGEEVRRLVI